jgi:hypothetical protein
MEDCGSVMGDGAPAVEVERIGDQIAELAAHLDAASARLLALIREFDARGGWNNGSARAPSGSASASASTSVRRASAYASPVHWRTCRCSLRHWRVASSRTPRSVR